MARLLVVSRSMALAMRLADVHEVIEHPTDQVAQLSPGEDIDAVVLDVGEPAAAIQALDRLRGSGYTTPVLVVSGYQPSWAGLVAIDLPAVVVVPLPITKAALLHGVDELTRGRPNRAPAAPPRSWNGPRPTVVPSPPPLPTPTAPEPAVDAVAESTSWTALLAPSWSDVARPAVPPAAAAALVAAAEPPEPEAFDEAEVFDVTADLTEPDAFAVPEPAEAMPVPQPLVAPSISETSPSEDASPPTVDDAAATPLSAPAPESAERTASAGWPAAPFAPAPWALHQASADQRDRAQSFTPYPIDGGAQVVVQQTAGLTVSHAGGDVDTDTAGVAVGWPGRQDAARPAAPVGPVALTGFERPAEAPSPIDEPRPDDEPALGDVSGPSDGTGPGERAPGDDDTTSPAADTPGTADPIGRVLDLDAVADGAGWAAQDFDWWRPLPDDEDDAPIEAVADDEVVVDAVVVDSVVVDAVVDDTEVVEVTPLDVPVTEAEGHDLWVAAELPPDDVLADDEPAADEIATATATDETVERSATDEIVITSDEVRSDDGPTATDPVDGPVPTPPIPLPASAAQLLPPPLPAATASPPPLPAATVSPPPLPVPPPLPLAASPAPPLPVRVRAAVPALPAPFDAFPRAVEAATEVVVEPAAAVGASGASATTPRPAVETDLFEPTDDTWRRQLAAAEAAARDRGELPTPDQGQPWPASVELGPHPNEPVPAGTMRSAQEVSESIAARRALLGRPDLVAAPSLLNLRLAGRTPAANGLFAPAAAANEVDPTPADDTLWANPSSVATDPATVEPAPGPPTPDRPPIEPVRVALEHEPVADPAATPVDEHLPAAALITALQDRFGELYGVGDTAQVLADEIVDRVRAEAVAVVVADGGRWRVAGGIGLRPIERRLALTGDHWLVAEVSDDGRAVLISDTDAIRPSLAGAPLAAWHYLLAVPVPGHQAFVVLARGPQAEPFETGDVARLAPAVREAASLLRTALQTRDLARRLASLRDLDSAIT